MEIRGYGRLIRDINENLVFTIIHHLGPISRTDIARVSGLSLPTLSTIIKRLLRTGFVIEAGEGESRGGRKPVLLKINLEAGHVIGIKLMEHSLATTVVDLEAEILTYRSFPLEDCSSPEVVLDSVRRAVQALEGDSDLNPKRLLGIGIGMAGVVDSDNGVCRYSPFFDWRDVDVAGYLQRFFHTHLRGQRCQYPHPGRAVVR